MPREGTAVEANPLHEMRRTEFPCSQRKSQNSLLFSFFQLFDDELFYSFNPLHKFLVILKNREFSAGTGILLYQTAQKPLKIRSSFHPQRV
jgi:hypothetical protein